MRHLTLLVAGLIASPLGAQSRTHQEAALELIALQGLEHGTRRADSAYVEWLLEQNPDLAAYRDVVERHAHRVYDWPTLKLQAVRVLTGLFSEQELRELAAFWKSPIGRRWAESAEARSLARGNFMDQRYIELGELLNKELEDAARRRGHKQPVVRFVVPS